MVQLRRRTKTQQEFKCGLHRNGNARPRTDRPPDRFPPEEHHRDYFLYRDFQSHNIMLRDGQPFLR